MRARIDARSGSTVLILAFDTATSVATSALVRGEDVLGERATTPIRVLEDVDALLREAGVEPRDLDALAVGIGPGSFTGVRMGLAVARALALSLDIPAAGVSTLAALAAGAPSEAVPLIDAKRRELFLEQDGEIVALPVAAFEAPGRICVGDGAVRYREQLESTGSTIPPDDSDVHLPRARFHALLAESFGPADELQPVYVRAPDADRTLA
jgi:tRNA threonylcarbamoyladenosine biosynthesis protein TsaB